MRVDERTETSMARHHLQSGVSGVKRGRLRGEVEAHAKVWRDEATADTANRTATGVSSGAGLGRFVGRGENGARRLHPQDPPLLAPTPPPRCQTPSCKPQQNLRPAAAPAGAP